MPAVDATEHLKVSIGGERWVLGQRAAYWIERRWLVIADVHFGKAATFRARGVPVPHGTTSGNLRRIDALIDRVIFAKDRAELEAATKAMDRVLLWNHYVVPQWTYGKVRTARWDRFNRPDPLPKYGFSGFPTVWWWDKDKAAKAGSRS